MKTKLYAIWDTHKLIAESQQVAVLPPSLKFMVSTFLILTQCKITENTAGQCCAPGKNIFPYPYHLSVLADVLGL